MFSHVICSNMITLSVHKQLPFGDGKHTAHRNGDDLGMVQMALGLPHYAISPKILLWDLCDHPADWQWLRHVATIATIIYQSVSQIRCICCVHTLQSTYQRLIITGEVTKSLIHNDVHSDGLSPKFSVSPFLWGYISIFACIPF